MSLKQYNTELSIGCNNFSPAVLESIAKVQEKEVKVQETSIKKQATSAKSKKATTEKKSRRLSNYERREYEKLESKIAEMEMEKEELEKSLYHNPPNDFTKVQDLSEKLSVFNEEIDVATERWMELAERDS